MNEQKLERGVLQDKKQSTKNTSMWFLKVNDKMFSGFDEYKDFNNGDEIAITYVENPSGGKVYNNIKAITLVQEQAGATATQAEQSEASITKSETVNDHPKIKTITSLNPDEFDKMVCEFNQQHADTLMGATQTHVFRVKKGGEEVESLQYVAIIYYK